MGMQVVLTPVPESSESEPAVTTMSDAEVLALTQVRLSPRQGQRLDDLLAMQRKESLAAPEQAEFLGLMQEYNRLWIRQSEALAEAVRRGLRQPLTP